MRNAFLNVLLLGGLLVIGPNSNAQQISLKEIMKGKDFIGHWPEREYWGPSNKNIYFNWNPEGNEEASHYRFSVLDSLLQKVQKEDLPPQVLPSNGEYCYEKKGDIYFWNTEKSKEVGFIETSVSREMNPQITKGGTHLLFQQGNNIYTIDRNSGAKKQITQLDDGVQSVEASLPPVQRYLGKEELSLIDQFKKEQVRKDLLEQKELLNSFYLNGKTLMSFSVNKSQAHQADEFKQDSLIADYYFLRLREKPNDATSSSVPSYVTESGFTEILKARPKVGSEQAKYSTLLYNSTRDEYRLIDNSALGDFQGRLFYGKAVWNEKGTTAIVVVKSMDHKNRWICLLNLQAAKYEVIDHQFDEAWIGGPGIVSWQEATSKELGWVSENEIWFKSEKSGYSHIYTASFNSETKNTNDRQGSDNGITTYLPKKQKQITKGDFETYDVVLSKNKEHFYYGSNEEDSGKRNWNCIKVDGSNKQNLISKKGRVDVTISSDEAYLLIRYSNASSPWELYLASRNDPMNWLQITDSKSEAFKSINWQEPKYVDFEAQDGQLVRARQYEPDEPNGAAVIFVHGAGYLQNAHSWWSRYHREYMFHNLLVEKGYTVLDIDYRGSAGYGREWRTGIYRHMGGKDLSDQVDGANYLVKELGIDSSRIGIYGGSYGGFITLMALFKEAETFACGAALRSVTDWAHYNHPYTSNILNTPLEDSIAYRNSSPIYFAEGLEDPLLICHGMIDMNVHFQDVVRLSQRLIDLGKEDWELAVYPLEGHTFQDPDSWYDEYRRILKLFETNLK